MDAQQENATSIWGGGMPMVGLRECSCGFLMPTHLPRTPIIRQALRDMTDHTCDPARLAEYLEPRTVVTADGPIYLREF